MHFDHWLKLPTSETRGLPQHLYGRCQVCEVPTFISNLYFDMGSVISKVKVLRIAVKQVLELSASYERLQKRIQVDPGLPVPNPTHSFWHDEPSPIANHVPDCLPCYVDVIIIGSGITGTSVARTLFREGGEDLRVLMLEARKTCSGATGRCVSAWSVS